MKTMKILSGPSGSGKSTLAAKIASQAEQDKLTCVTHSTDNFWIKDGKYIFNAAMLGVAHKWNQTQTEISCRNGVEVVIIDNTNLTWKEIVPYLTIAKLYGYEAEQHIPEQTNSLSCQDLAKRNVHNVPLEAIERMVGRFQGDMSDKIKKFMLEG